MVLFVCFFINLLVIFLSVVSPSAFFQSKQTPVLNKSKDKVEFNLLLSLGCNEGTAKLGSFVMVLVGIEEGKKEISLGIGYFKRFTVSNLFEQYSPGF